MPQTGTAGAIIGGRQVAIGERGLELEKARLDEARKARRQGLGLGIGELALKGVGLGNEIGSGLASRALVGQELGQRVSMARDENELRRELAREATAAAMDRLKAELSGQKELVGLEGGIRKDLESLGHLNAVDMFERTSKFGAGESEKDRQAALQRTLQSIAAQSSANQDEMLLQDELTKALQQVAWEREMEKLGRLNIYDVEADMRRFGHETDMLGLGQKHAMETLAAKEQAGILDREDMQEHEVEQLGRRLSHEAAQNEAAQKASMRELAARLAAEPDPAKQQALIESAKIMAKDSAILLGELRAMNAPEPIVRSVEAAISSGTAAPGSASVYGGTLKSLEQIPEYQDFLDRANERVPVTAGEKSAYGARRLRPQEHAARAWAAVNETMGQDPAALEAAAEAILSQLQSTGATIPEGDISQAHLREGRVLPVVTPRPHPYLGSFMPVPDEENYLPFSDEEYAALSRALQSLQGARGAGAAGKGIERLDPASIQLLKAMTKPGYGRKSGIGILRATP